MTQGTQDDGIGTVALSGTVLHVHWTPGILIDEDSAWTMITQARELSSGQELPVLVEIAGVRGITYGAGAVFATEWPPSRTAMVGDSPVDEVIAAFYTARHKPASAVRFFTSITEAMKWLTGPKAINTPAQRRP